MTPSQLEHLKLIDAHLERLLAIAEKRTPGEWLQTKDGDRCYGHGDYGSTARLKAGDSSIEIANYYQKNQQEDATFIASCAGNAEAGWRATRSMIDYLLMMHKHGDGYRYIGLTEDILAAFPLELIQKP